MARAPLFGIRLDDETKQRWVAAAEQRGYSHLGEFVKACVEAEVSQDAPPPRRAPVPLAAAAGKRSYEPDFKKGTTKK